MSEPQRQPERERRGRADASPDVSELRLSVWLVRCCCSATPGRPVDAAPPPKAALRRRHADVTVSHVALAYGRRGRIKQEVEQEGFFFSFLDNSLRRSWSLRRYAGPSDRVKVKQMGNREYFYDLGRTAGLVGVSSKLWASRACM